MTLFKLALKNIKKSFRDYTIYFITLVLGVGIFYVFNAMADQSVMLKATSQMLSIIEMLKGTISAISIFVAFVLGFLIVFAGSFLIKRRKKEFGIYMLLGMSKRKISAIIFTETIFIGIISLVCGLVAGIIVSQGMSIIVADMFEADMTEFRFLISKTSIIRTVLYFCIMYTVVLVFQTIIVGKASLINLLNAGKKNEKPINKNPWICMVVFIISSFVLATAYQSVTVGFEDLDRHSLMVQIIKGIVTTVLIFWSMSGIMIFVFKSNSRFYYKCLRPFTIRELSSRINTTVFSGSIICLMLFVTICVLSGALSVRKAINDNLKSLVPADVNIIMSTSGQSKGILERLEENNVDMEMFCDSVHITTYEGEQLTCEDTFGAGLENFYIQHSWEEVIRVSDYNMAAEIYGLDKIELADDEYVIMCNASNYRELRNNALYKGITFIIGEKEYHPKYNRCMDGFLMMEASQTNFGFVVLPDTVNLEGFGEYREYFIANYNADSEEQRQKISGYINSREFNELINPPGKWSYAVISTKEEIYEAGIGLTAIMVFIGMYLGLVFMISGAALLSLKELSDASDNYEKYQILRKLGVDEGQIRRSLFCQCSLFFMIPLAGAAVHSVFGIWACMNVLEIYGFSSLYYSIVVTALIIAAVYGIYFCATYFCCRKIINLS